MLKIIHAVEQLTEYESLNYGEETSTEVLSTKAPSLGFLLNSPWRPKGYSETFNVSSFSYLIVEVWLGGLFFYFSSHLFG